MNFVAQLRDALRLRGEDSGDVLARMLMAAQEDSAFRGQILSLLRMPVAQREPMIHTALHEMRLRGEPEAVCAAFATLGTDAGAAIARRILSDEPAP